MRHRAVLKDFSNLLAAVEQGDDAAALAEATRAYEAGLVSEAESPAQALVLIVDAAAQSGTTELRYRPHLQRLLRANAAMGAPWAAVWLAQEWSLFLPSDEVAKWRYVAAAAGHRRSAYLCAAAGAPDNPAARLDLLEVAYGDGEPEPSQSHSRWHWHMTRNDLADAALYAADVCQVSGDESGAETWFLRATECEDWQVFETGHTQATAVFEFAEWCLATNRESQARILLHQLVIDAARNSLGTEGSLRSEHKTYRAEWQADAARERARHDGLARYRSLHGHRTGEAERAVVLLCDNYFLNEQDRAMVVDHLLRTPGGASLAGQLRAHYLRAGQWAAEAPEPESEDFDSSLARAFLWWFVRDLPSSLAESVGQGEAAARYRADFDAVAQKEDPIRALQWGELLPIDNYLSSRPAVQGETKALPPAWSSSLGMRGSRRFLGHHRERLPLLRGTPLWMTLWLSLDCDAPRLRDSLDQIERLTDLASDATSRLAVGPVQDEDEWPDPFDDRHWEHFDDQRAVLERFVSQL